MMRTAPVAVLLVLAFSATSAAGVRIRGAVGRDLLVGTTGMQPELVAKTLARVEDEWRSQALDFMRCNMSANASGSGAEECTGTPKAFLKSCSTVVSAVVQASSGDRAVVTEYMGTICDEPELTSSRKTQCQALAAAVTGSMSADNYNNRGEPLDLPAICGGFFTGLAAEERSTLERERKEKEEEDKRIAAEREEAEKRAMEEAKAEEQRRKEEEAAKEAAEVQQRAQEAAARLAAKKEEAEQKAEEARRKMEEAQAAAEETRHLQAHVQALKNATLAAPTNRSATDAANTTGNSSAAAADAAGNATAGATTAPGAAVDAAGVNGTSAAVGAGAR